MIDRDKDRKHRLEKERYLMMIKILETDWLDKHTYLQTQLDHT